MPLHYSLSNATEHAKEMQNGGMSLSSFKRLAGMRGQKVWTKLLWGGADLEHVSAADHVIHLGEAHVSHVLAQLLRHHEQKVDHVLRLSSKFGAQLRVLPPTAKTTIADSPLLIRCSHMQKIMWPPLRSLEPFKAA